MKPTFLIVTLFLLFSGAGISQTTMMTEISYPLLDRLIRVAKASNPQMKSLTSEVNIAELNVKRAKISWFDIANISYTRNKNLNSDPNASALLVNGNGYQYGVNINIGTILQKPAQVKIAKQQVNIALSDKEEYDLALENTVKQRYFTYIEQLTILRVQTKAVQDAESLLNLVTKRFEKAEITYDVYSIALTAYNTASQQKISFEAALLMAKASLESILGTKMENIAP